MKEENKSIIRVNGDGTTIGPVATGRHANASINYGVGAAPAGDVQRVETLLEALLEQIHQHAGEMTQPYRAEKAVEILRDEIREEDSNPTLIKGALQRLSTAVDTVGPLVALAGKLTDAIQPWLR
jgi:hypothetical protein